MEKWKLFIFQKTSLKRMEYKHCIKFMLCLFIVACTNPQEPVLTKNELIPVLIDLHFSEAVIQSFDRKAKDSMANIYYNQVFQIHGISKEDFDQSMEILRNDPIMTEIIYNAVVDSLESRVK